MFDSIRARPGPEAAGLAATAVMHLDMHDRLAKASPKFQRNRNGERALRNSGDIHRFGMIWIYLIYLDDLDRFGDLA